MLFRINEFCRDIEWKRVRWDFSGRFVRNFELGGRVYIDGRVRVGSDIDIRRGSEKARDLGKRKYKCRNS